MDHPPSSTAKHASMEHLKLCQSLYSTASLPSTELKALSFALVHCVDRSLSTVFAFSKRYPSVKCMFGVLLFNLI